MKEEYKIIQYADNYAISRYGNVKNVKTGLVLKQVVNKQGYKTVSLTVGKRNKTFRVHRLVAEAFIDNKNNKPYVNHIDGNKQNNRFDNLEWCTAKENDSHARRTGLKQQGKQVVAKHCVTGEVKSFASISDCANYFECNKAYIHRALNATYGNKMFKNYILFYLK